MRVALSTIIILNASLCAGNLKFTPDTIYCDLNGFGSGFGYNSQLNTKVQNFSKDTVSIAPVSEYIAKATNSYTISASTGVLFQFSKSDDHMIYSFDSNFVTTDGVEYLNPTLITSGIALSPNQIDTFGGFELGSGNLAQGVPYNYAPDQTLVRLVFSTGAKDFDTLYVKTTFHDAILPRLYMTPLKSSSYSINGRNNPRLRDQVLFGNQEAHPSFQ
jgi:hypothetical protein